MNKEEYQVKMRELIMKIKEIKEKMIEIEEIAHKLRIGAYE